MNVTVTAANPREAIQQARQALPVSLSFRVNLTVQRLDNSTFVVYA
jgi:hypothetical protein